MRRSEHTREQGLRVHHLANLGGLVSLAALEALPPDLLLGSLLAIARQLPRMRVQSLEIIRTLGEEKLAERAAEKRAWRAYEKGSGVQAIYLEPDQLRALILRLGGESPAGDDKLVPTLMALLEERR